MRGERTKCTLTFILIVFTFAHPSIKDVYSISIVSTKDTYPYWALNTVFTVCLVNIIETAYIVRNRNRNRG